MSLVPAASVRLGNLRYQSQAFEVTCTLGLLPVVDSARVTLPAPLRLDAVPGDPASVALDGGEGAATVLTGTLLALLHGPLAVVAVVADGGADLAALRPATTWQGQDAGAVIRALAGDASVDVGSADLGLPLVAYTADQSRTAAEHIAALAALAGGTAGFDGDGALQVAARPAGPPALALRYGRELLDYQVLERPAGAAQLVAVGSGPAGSAGAPDALRPSDEPLSGGAPDPGPDAVWRPLPVLRVPAAADTASAALAAAAAAAASRVRARCFLLPALRPGMVFEVQDVPDGLSGGPWLATRVVHRLRPGSGGATLVEGESAGAGGAGLLAGALSAAGGLL